MQEFIKCHNRFGSCCYFKKEKVGFSVKVMNLRTVVPDHFNNFTNFLISANYSYCQNIFAGIEITRSHIQSARLLKHTQLLQYTLLLSVLYVPCSEKLRTSLQNFQMRFQNIVKITHLLPKRRLCYAGKMSDAGRLKLM